MLWHSFFSFGRLLGIRDASGLACSRVCPQMPGLRHALVLGRDLCLEYQQEPGVRECGGCGSTAGGHGGGSHRLPVLVPEKTAQVSFWGQAQGWGTTVGTCQGSVPFSSAFGGLMATQPH